MTVDWLCLSGSSCHRRGAGGGEGTRPGCNRRVAVVGLGSPCTHCAGCRVTLEPCSSVGMWVTSSILGFPGLSLSLAGQCACREGAGCTSGAHSSSAFLASPVSLTRAAVHRSPASQQFSWQSWFSALASPAQAPALRPPRVLPELRFLPRSACDGRGWGGRPPGPGSLHSHPPCSGQSSAIWLPGGMRLDCVPTENRKWLGDTRSDSPPPSPRPGQRSSAWTRGEEAGEDLAQTLLSSNYSIYSKHCGF